jgi:hypothetical protein
MSPQARASRRFSINLGRACRGPRGIRGSNGVGSALREQSRVWLDNIAKWVPSYRDAGTDNRLTFG